MSVDVREWYHVTKLKVSKHAFVSPFEMMEMLTMVNVGKKLKYRIRVGQTGKKIQYETLNIMVQSAHEQIASQVNVHGTGD